MYNWNYYQVKDEYRKRKAAETSATSETSKQGVKVKKHNTTEGGSETRSRSADVDGNATADEPPHCTSSDEDAMLNPDDEDMDSRTGTNEAGALVTEGSMSVLEAVDGDHWLEIEAEMAVKYDQRIVLERAGDEL